MSSGHLIAKTVEMLHAMSAETPVGPHVPTFASVSVDADEYIYSLPDSHFIRVIMKRHALPSWRHCGDWAQVRVERFDQNMDSIGRAELWVFVFRDGQWQRLPVEAGGIFLDSNRKAIEMPPYVVRCFNLDKKELTDNAD